VNAVNQATRFDGKAWLTHKPHQNEIQPFSDIDGEEIYLPVLKGNLRL